MKNFDSTVCFGDKRLPKQPIRYNYNQKTTAYAVVSIVDQDVCLT